MFDPMFCFAGIAAACQALPSENTPKPLLIPFGSPPTIDGRHASGEWEDAVTVYFSDGSQCLLMRNGEFLYVGIQANEPGRIATNIFIQRSDEISILHSSAALGTAIYQKEEGSWQQVRNFAWRCRNTGSSESAQAEREEFLAEEGWLAANGMMGTPNEMEYKIRIPEQDFRLAAVYIKSTAPYEKIPWPAHLEDDCIAPASNGLPLELHFSPDQWVQLDFSKGNEDETTP
jgi:hypothetical protein